MIKIIAKIIYPFIENKKWFKELCALIFVMTMLVGCGQVAKQVTDQSYDDHGIDSKFISNVSLQQANTPQSDEIVFVGDSIARNLANYCVTYNVTINNLTVKNCGHGGDNIRDMVIGGDWQKAFEDNPKIVVINIGINDIQESHDMATIETQYRYVVINAERTGSQIILLTPVPAENQNGGARNNIRTLTNYILTFANQPNVKILNVYALLSNSIGQNPDYFTADPNWPGYFGDKLHPNCNGMKVIIDNIKSLTLAIARVQR